MNPPGRISGIVLGLATMLFPLVLSAHGSETLVEQRVGDYMAEFSYDAREIRTGELFDFHSALIAGLDIGAWEFAPYTRVDFEIRKGADAIYTKTFGTTALGFAAYTFTQPGKYQLLIRYIDGAQERCDSGSHVPDGREARLGHRLFADIDLSFAFHRSAVARCMLGHCRFSHFLAE